ncbi:MAG: hypothetical protein LBM08_07560 [Dysgonamonadaceae bacterium]|jgi:hypothetical protein|nr:hypothetical protein [Dysgonamonadaceae bacterium]
MKNIFLLLIAVFFSNLLTAQITDGLQLHYSFEADAGNTSLVSDITDNGYNGTLFNNAILKKVKNFPVLALGNQNGYVDMGTKTGELIAALEDFSIAAYLYIGKYHLFFKTEGDGNGIKKAVSNTLTGGYILQDNYLQQTTEAVEGSCVFRFTNQEKYILMYDLSTEQVSWANGNAWAPAIAEKTVDGQYKYFVKNNIINH